jgi:hypothetical protein
MFSFEVGTWAFVVSVAVIVCSVVKHLRPLLVPIAILWILTQALGYHTKKDAVIGAVFVSTGLIVSLYVNRRQLLSDFRGGRK